MDSTLINSRQSATTNIANVEKTSSYGAESNLTGSATHFINLLQQKLISKTTVDDTSESDSSGEDSTDAKESQDKQDASMDEQVEKDKLGNRNDMLNSPTTEISVAQEENTMNSMVQARNNIVSTKIESTVQTEPISNVSFMDNEETTQNKGSLVGRLQSVTPEIGKLDGAESTLTTNSIENQTGDTKIRDIKNKPVFTGKIDETTLNTQNFVVSESSKKSTGMPNITSNVSDKKPPTLDTISAVGNLQSVIPEIGKLDGAESTLTTNPIEHQTGDTKIQDIKSKSAFMSKIDEIAVNIQNVGTSESSKKSTDTPNITSNISDKKPPTSDATSMIGNLQSVIPEIGKLDGLESTIITNSIELQTGDTKIQDIKGKSVFMSKIDEPTVNTQNFVVSESSKKSTDTPNITSNVSDKKPPTLDTISAVGNLQSVIPEIGKLDGTESTITTNPIEPQTGDAKIQDIKSKSIFTPETSKALLNKQEESNSTLTETKAFENITGIQMANLMVEKSNSTNENADFTIKVNDSTTVLQDKTATSIVKTLVSGESKQVTVQLEPGNLGKIEISLQSTAKEVSLNFKLTSSHAKSLISGIATQLEQVLNNQIAADKTANDKVTMHQTPASSLDGAQFSFGQHQFGQQANQNMTKSRLNEQYRNNKIGQDEVIAKKQDNEQRNEKNIISILA